MCLTVAAVTYVSSEGVAETVQGSVGTTIMQTAVARGVDGIVGECGGNLMCATCHVYVRPEWVERLPALAEEEDEMLEDTMCPRKDNSRLSCQLVLANELDGIVVDLPEEQI
jgi:2Fe-2S ferredoxin